MSKKNSEPTVKFGDPGPFAVCRDQVGSDLVAAVLLYRIKAFFNPDHPIKKLTRDGREWIAMSRDNWGRTAGLTVAETKNRAIPILKKCMFVKIKAMCVVPHGPKLLWISLDLVELANATTPADMIPFFPAGEKVIGSKTGLIYLTPSGLARDPARFVADIKVTP